MKNILKVLLIGTVVSFLSGCGEPTIDASSEETLKASMQEVMAELDQDKKKELEQAVQGIYMVIALSASSNGASQEKIQETVLEQFDGKTADDIFELAEEIKERIRSGSN